ncbi:hypothetical protein HOLleu_12161 [Holothuria leucospilota]|uniref:Uncharacterized protein n=1 Tax=Holothuria leucospilota TaxID=206669 RepID=A0A9Q1CAU7_HOLLE|nr:hypothetical protein HOLleu_12161 [Holothuria leucospilota]
MKFSVTITVALLFVASASAIKWGRCTTTTQLEDFDLMRFQGPWYQAAGSKNVGNGVEGRCHEIEYSISGERQLSFVAYSVYDDLDTNMTSIIEGVINFDLETSMKWEVQPSKCKYSSDGR